MSLKANMRKLSARVGKADQKMALALQQPFRGADHLSPELFSRQVRVKTWVVDGFFGVTINGSYSKNDHMILFPGGAYTLEPTRQYRKLGEYFAIKKHVRVTILQCPLSPEYTALDVHQYMMRVYKKLVEEYPADRFLFFGDFSGGSLALSFLQELKEMNTLPMPVKTVVISPWLDISLENPKIKIAQKWDPVLPLEALREVGRTYRGILEADHPFVSPLYGNWNGLGKILIFSGTDEILTPDCELLAEKEEKMSETEITYKKGADMIHDWIFFPSRESEITLELISSFLWEEDQIFR